MAPEGPEGLAEGTRWTPKGPSGPEKALKALGLHGSAAALGAMTPLGRPKWHAPWRTRAWGVQGERQKLTRGG